MSYSTFQTIIVTIPAGLAAVFVVLHLQERRREREALRAEERRREAALPRRIPGLPRDGRTLSRDEKRVLREVETDSWIDVPEPAYDTGESL